MGAVPTAQTDPTTEERAPHTVVITVTYDQPVTKETLDIWEQTARMYDGVENVSVAFGARTRPRR